MAKNPKNLIQKPGSSVWYVKLIVPVDVRKVLGRSQFKKSLQTTSVIEAERRKGAYLSAWWDLIETARNGTPLPDGWQATVMATLSAFGDAFQNRRRALIGENIAPMVLTPEMKAGMVSTPSLLAMLESLAQPGQTWGNLETQLQTYKNDELLIQQSFPVLMTDKQKLPADQHLELMSLVQSPATYRPASPITDRRLESFRAFRVKEEVAAKTIDQQESKLRDLSAYIKKEGQRLAKSVVASWLAAKSLSSKTKTQYLLAGSTFWQWATEHDAQWKSDFAGMDNPFAGHKLPKRKVADIAKTARKAFTPDELQLVFSAARDEGQETLCDLILLGSLTGCRIEELAQFTKASVVMIEGVRSFKVEDSKTVAGVREIPIHPLLAPIVDRLIESTADGFLLPSSGGNKYGIRSDSLSKSFGRLKTSLGFTGQHVFHSVRAAVITQLLRAGVPGNVVANIVGHETGLVTFDVYDEGASPQQKLEALVKLPFKFS